MADRTLRARLVAETSGFTARMAAAEAQLARMERAPVAAARGMTQLQSGMRVLAFQATGLTGPLGAAASSLGMFALGGPLMLAVTAGLGAGALAAKVFGKEIEEFGRKTHAAALDKAISSIHTAALKLSETRLDQLNQDLERTQRAIKELTRTAVPAIGGGFILPTEEAEQLKLLESARLTFQREITKEMEKQVSVAKALRGTVLGLMPEMAAIPGGVPGVMTIGRQAAGGLLPPIARPGVVDIEPRFQGAPGSLEALFGTGLQGTINKTIELNNVSLDLKRKEHAALNASTMAVQRHADANELASLRTQQAAASLITGVGVMIQGLIAGGGAGGFLGGALGLVGGIVGAANPVLGAVLSAGGGIIATIAAKSRRDPIPVYDRAVRSELHDLSNQIRQVLISATVVDPLGRPLSVLRYEQDRQTRRDANPRLP